MIPYFAVPDLGRSVHMLSVFSGVLLLTPGLLGPRRYRGSVASRVAFWFLIYSDPAIVAAFLLAGVWGAGNSSIPLAAGTAHGSDFQETAITVVAYSSGPTGITSFALILWGVRIVSPQSPGDFAKAASEGDDRWQIERRA